MKSKIVGKVPTPRKDTSVKFRSGSGQHSKTTKAVRREKRVALNKGQEVFQSAS